MTKYFDDVRDELRPEEAYLSDGACGEPVFSFNHFRTTYEAHFARALDPYTEPMNAFHLRLTSPHAVGGGLADQPIARVGLASMIIRDEHLLRIYSDLWNAGTSMFSWYGGYHTLVLSEQLQQFGDAQFSYLAHRKQ
jgi:hypothetical protein